jgi:predicted RecB family nuclease
MRLKAEQLLLSATDLSKHLGCRHLTDLDRAVAEGQLAKPDWASPMLALLQKRGLAHETAYLAHLKDNGREILDLGELEGSAAAEATIQAMRDGVDAIVQAELRDGRWNGRADILVKVPEASDLGAWSYEVIDTKLSQETKGGTVLQLCLYTELVGKIQGRAGELMHVVKPGEGFPKESFRFAEFAAYYRVVRNQLEVAVQQPPSGHYPIPVPQCDICAWWKRCDKKRHDDDHLCLVAGVQALHVHELNRQGTTTLEQFAEQDQPVREKPQRGNEEAYHKAHGQAKVQLKGRQQGEPVHELLEVEPGEGLSRLPVPDPGDVFFDFEADPFVDGGGLEYLFGFVLVDTGEPTYRSVWGLSRNAERLAFEEFMDFLVERWKAYPGMHVYHFSAYETAALKRLMGRHATRGMELDRFLRAERFIDLHAVVKRGLRASVEKYSIKDLEPFFGYKRILPLPEATAALRRVEAALELGEAGSVSDEDLASVAEYNREDCEATWKLRDWLEERRVEAENQGQVVLRPEVKSGDASDDIEERDANIQAVFERLVGDLPEDREAWNEDEQAVWLLAHQLEYYVRETKCALWEYFRIHDLEHAELHDEQKAVAGLEFVGEVEGGTARCPAHRYRFPGQEVGIKVGDHAHEVGGDKAKVGTILRVDQVARTVDLKKTQKSVGYHPNSIMVKEVVTPVPLDASVLALGQSVADHGVDGGGPFRAARDLLLRKPPRVPEWGIGDALRRDGEDVVDAAIRLAESLDCGVLPIQGPPGTGKTYTGARMIVALARAGKRVGVTAVSHKVIRNLLEEAVEAAEESGGGVEFAHKCTPSEDPPDGIEEIRDNAAALATLHAGKVLGGTAWLWAREDAVESLDYLFVDEAGQMSLVNALAAGRAAKNLILLGDPQQLEQPQKGAHPEGSEVAALDHVLAGRKTLPRDRGLFLDVTRRLHPSICTFTSDVFYEGRLGSHAGLERQAVIGDTRFVGSGLVYVPVEHEGNQTHAPEEVEAIARIVADLNGCRWRDAEGQERELQEAEIVVVAPYNAQVGALTDALPDGVRVGTVDKFQGQQAPVVIYSMTSSSAEDAPRGMSFLYSPNRLNVATSRAKCVSILVAAMRLLEPSCRVPDQMRWANGLCRYRELATLTVL